MLEKTAASLEPCGLQRVLPCANKSFRSRRQLHTTFWQHGAADIELSSAWQTLMHGTLDFTNMESQARGSALTASTFLLDFLYPTGAVALMRRFNPVSSDRLDNIRPSSGGLRRLAPRLYASSTSRSQASKSDSRTNPTKDGVELVNSEEKKPLEQSDTITHPIERVTEDVQDESFTSPDNTDRTDEATDHFSALDGLLTSDNPELADQIWYHYQALDPQSQNIYLSRVFVCLSRTGRISDSWKISELFHKLDITRWNSYAFVAGVRSEVNLQNNNEALEIFIKALTHEAIEQTALVEALDLVLAQALRSNSLELLRDLWKHYPEMKARWDFEGITSQLMHVASVPGIAEKALGFPRLRSEFVLDSAIETGAEALQALQKILVRRALLVCSDDRVVPLLHLTKDPLAFEEFLRQAIPKRRYKLATNVYSIYRQLPSTQPSRAVLYEVFKAYTTMKAPMPSRLAGLELLWGDWYTFHPNPSRRAYQTYLAFHASLGDKEKVHNLWKDFVDLYADENVLQGDDTFAHLLQVHTVLGEVEEVQRIFDSMSSQFGLKPNTYCWNILINAYAKVGDYDGAIRTFDRLSAIGRPDKFSYGTLMQMAGSRGDLGYTVDLYGRARKAGILANDAILSSLVDAYCQNDSFKEAHDVCIRAARKGILITRLWNKLLHYHALRRDLVAVNRLLDTMAEKRIPYNSFTYEQLLLSLAICRQSQHALHLLAVGMKDNVFEVTTKHFYIVMGALVKTGEPEPVLSLHRMMKQYGIPTSSGIVFRLVQALTQYKKLTVQQRSRKTTIHWLGDALRSFYDLYGYRSRWGPENKQPKYTPSPRSNEYELLKGGSEPFHFGTMVYMFVELKDFVRARDLVDLYRYVFQNEQDGILPVSMLNSVMLADLREGKYDRVKETWQVLYDTAKKVARSEDYIEDLPHTSQISPRYRYVLSGGFKIIQEVLFIEDNAAGLASLVREVRGEGFELDSKNWNTYVQCMVQLKQYGEAFKTCEEFLMPNWSGWFTARVRESVKNQLPLELRRKGSAPRYLRPVTTTLYRLAQGYMELDRMSPWSVEAGRMIRELEEECPQVIRAIKSMIRVYSDLEYEIFENLDSAAAVDEEYDEEYERGDERYDQ